MRSARLLNGLSTTFIVLTGVLAASYALIFILNPFSVQGSPLTVVVTPTPIGTPTPTDPPTWTPTSSPAPSTPRPSNTPTRTSTPRPTRTSLPTDTPTPSITPTPTEDVCKSLKLLGPPPGQKYNQYDTPFLVWTFGRPLNPDEHFDLLLDPPGAGQESIGWPDETNSANKDCSDSPGYCEYQVGLNGVYSGGRFMWTVAILRAGADRRVLGTVCAAPDPYFFQWP